MCALAARVPVRSTVQALSFLLDLRRKSCATRRPITLRALRPIIVRTEGCSPLQLRLVVKWSRLSCWLPFSKELYSRFRGLLRESIQGLTHRRPLGHLTSMHLLPAYGFDCSLRQGSPKRSTNDWRPYCGHAYPPFRCSPCCRRSRRAEEPSLRKG